MRTLSSLLILVLVALPLQAAERGTDDATAGTPPDVYEVELLVFLRNAAPDDEAWPEDAALPSPARAIATVAGAPPPEFPPALRLPEREAGAAPLPEPAASDRIQPLAAADYRLTPHAQALRRNGLRPLVHAAWRQPVGGRDNPDWLWLEGGPLYGLVRVSLGRYLHIDTDLALAAPGAALAERPTIHARDHRRMRSGELHHIDHPAFGILVQINPYEPPPPADRPAAEALMLESMDEPQQAGRPATAR